MKITEIIVSAGRTFNHPYESYSNLRPQVTLKSTLEDGDNPQQAVKALQAQAEQQIEDHKQRMLAQMEALYELQLAERDIMSLEEQIKKASERLVRLREDRKALLEHNGQEELPL